jgi:hypothetical protein
MTSGVGSAALRDNCGMSRLKAAISSIETQKEGSRELTLLYGQALLKTLYLFSETQQRKLIFRSIAKLLVLAFDSHLLQALLVLAPAGTARVEVLDVTDQVTTETFAGYSERHSGCSRSTFRLPLPTTGVRYVVTVHAFEFGPRGSL